VTIVLTLPRLLFILKDTAGEPVRT